MADEKAIAVGTSTAKENINRAIKKILVWRSKRSCKVEKKVEPKEKVSNSGSADAKTAEPAVEDDKNKAAEKFTNSYAAGVSPSRLFTCGINAGQWQFATGKEQVEIQLPIDMVVWIVGKAGETIRDIRYFSRARIELLKPNRPCDDGEQSNKGWIVRITGGKKEMETAIQLVEDIMVLAKIARKSPPLSSEQPAKTRESYSEWYKAKFDNHATPPPQHNNVPQPQPQPQPQPEDLQYGKPRPHEGPPPHAQPCYGQKQQTNQAQSTYYGQSCMPPPPQQTCSYPYFFSFAPAANYGGYGQTSCSFYPPEAAASSGQQQAFPPAAGGSAGLFPAPFIGFLVPPVVYYIYPAAAFGAPPHHCCCSSLNPAYAAQPTTQAHQPGAGYDDQYPGGGYDGCSSDDDSFV